MSADLPDQISVTNISGDIVASPLNNNFTAEQTAVNDLITALSDGTAGQVLTAVDSNTVEWADPGIVTYRKTTSKAVNTTTTATDLLNGEITLAAGAMGASGLLRMTAWGDTLNNTGSTIAGPRMQVVLGGTTITDTAAMSSLESSTLRSPWRLTVEILNTATNAQITNFAFSMAAAGSLGGLTSGSVTTGEGAWSIAYAGTGTTALILAEVLATAAIDTTAATTFELKVINGSASASYETKLFGALVEVI